MSRTIFLVGARASGKTTLGRLLAEALACPFLDMDDLMLEVTGKTTDAIVAAEGWDGFRARETELLHNCRGRAGVIATGGGVVLAPANRAFMQEHGVVFYLKAPAEELARRLVNDPKATQRPSLTGQAPHMEIARILAEREPLYQEAAHHVLAADGTLETELARALALIQDAMKKTE